MVSFNINCVLGQYVTKDGRQVTDLMTKNGTRFKEVVTDLGKGNLGIRKIYPDKVVDCVFGRVEEYIPSPNGIGVIQISNGCRSYFPEIEFSKLKSL